MLRQRLSRLEFTDIFVYLLGAFIIGVVLVGTILTIVQGKYAPRAWFDLVLFGLTLGSIYSLIALGYTLVYGILRMINFAHSEVFMSGPYVAYFLATGLGASGFIDQNPVVALLLIFVVAMSASTGIAILVERLAYRPLRHAPRLVPLITAIGMSFFLQYTFYMLFGPNLKVYPQVSSLSTSFQFGCNIVDGKTLCDFQITYIQIFVMAAAGLLMLGLHQFVQRTKVGKAMRAVSEDRETAALMGINVNQIIVITFALGGALAGAAGVLYVLVFNQVSAFMGFLPGLKAFTAAVLGGIGNIPGAMVGGLFLGVVESIGPILFLDSLGVAAPYQLKDAVAFTMLVLVLIFRPSGILGEKLTEKKA
ncbi:MAG TPA: branched-chain amino acid ABC transporter permease [Anaerolineae bacterium]